MVNQTLAAPPALVAWLGALSAQPRQSDEWVGPGLLGFVVIVGLCVATFFLWRNMNKQLRKIRFDQKKSDSEQTDETSADQPDRTER
ncbi:MAG TPA: hypothetical protein VIL34_16100 [Actinopolymorphaceae bacterium]